MYVIGEAASLEESFKKRCFENVCTSKQDQCLDTVLCLFVLNYKAGV